MTSRYQVHLESTVTGRARTVEILCHRLQVLDSTRIDVDDVIVNFF